LPPHTQVVYLIPDIGFSNPVVIAWAGLNLLYAASRSPLAMWRLVKVCRQQGTGRETWRRVLRYAPFLRMRPDVIQFDFSMTASLYPLLGTLLHAPTVVSCRGADIHMWNQRPAYDQESRLSALCQATAVHCVSAEMASAVTQISGRTEGIWINRPAVPVDEIPTKTGYNSDAPLIVAVGRLTWKKGFDYLLAVFMKLKQAGVPFRAQIIGEGELRSFLRFSIDDLSLSQEVKLVGSLPAVQVLARLREADIFVLSSHEEGISNAVLEAMSSGLPIVTTRAGGMDEVVQDGIEGFLVPVRDIAMMTDRIQRLLLDPALRQQMGRAARLRAEADFSLERQALVFEQIYQSVTGLGTAQAPS
ncbi:MAG TPA: glycosyltransferase family 4 protein, partial [Aggregatilineaceae bacterium]|nr:glycosyltransferase family 4 protein [Aggregatilineaceae bacterium]